MADESLSVSFFDGTSEGVSLMVTYNYVEGNPDKSALTEFVITGGSPKYPQQTSDMDLSVMTDGNGNLLTASAFLKDGGAEVFACAVGGGPLGNNFQWLDTEGNTLSSDNCSISGSGVNN